MGAGAEDIPAEWRMEQAKGDMMYQVVLYATMLCLSAAIGYTIYVALAANTWHPFAAFLATAGLEGLGFISIRLLASIVEHNRSLSATEKIYKLPPWRAWLPVVSYFLIVSGLTTLLKIVPELYVYSLILFPAAGLLVGWAVMENATLQQYAASKAQARLEAKQVRLEKKQQPKQPEPTPQTDIKPGKIDRNLLVAQLRTTPGATNAQLATPFGVSAEAVRKVRKKITPAELGLTK